ncbi:Pentatricopeptide repeat-containing protein, partial [Drosera capensis]
MNEMGSNPSVETFNCLIDTYARGGMYKESEAVLRRMTKLSFEKNRDSLNGVIEGFRQGGRYEEAVQAYVEMKNARCGPDERTLEAMLSVYSFAGLVEESEENFQEIKNLVISPSIICYCMMLAVYAKNERLHDAYSLLEEMAHSKKSNVVQAIGQLIQGDFDDESNWQIMDYVFDQINAQDSNPYIQELELKSEDYTGFEPVVDSAMVKRWRSILFATKEPKPLDWDYYRKGVGNKIVDMCKEAYDTMLIPKHVSGVTPEYNAKLDAMPCSSMLTLAGKGYEDLQLLKISGAKLRCQGMNFAMVIVAFDSRSESRAPDLLEFHIEERRGWSSAATGGGLPDVKDGGGGS